jgi:hypothetical protein
MQFGFLGHHTSKATSQTQPEAAPHPAPAKSSPDAINELMAEWIEVPAGQSDGGTSASDVGAVLTPEEVQEALAACRAKVAAALFATSKEYKVLCGLAHSDMTACDDIMNELRRRLAGNLHYNVLGKLDEAFAIALARGPLTRS